MRVVPTPQIPCVFSGKMRLAFNVTVNSYDTRPTAPGFRIFFQLKRASRKPFQIPCVFSMKVRLAFKVIVNLYVMRSIAPTFLVFFRRTCASQESCRIPWVHFPCVFSGSLRLAFRSDCELTRDAANCSLIPNTFQGKRASQEGFLRVATAIANFHSYPSQEESQILTKEHCTGDVGLFDSQFLTNRVALVRKGNVRSCVTHNSSKRMSHQKVGMSKVAYHRMLVGGLDVVKRAKR